MNPSPGPGPDTEVPMSDTILFRLSRGGDLLDEIAARAEGLGMRRGTVQVIGALERASLGYYDQARQEYEPHEVEEPVELLAGLGNVSLKDGEVFVHLHLTLSRRDGSCLGGHANPGCVVFAGECALREVEGPDLVREHDPETGLFLWRR